MINYRIHYWKQSHPSVIHTTPLYLLFALNLKQLAWVTEPCIQSRTAYFFWVESSLAKSDKPTPASQMWLDSGVGRAGNATRALRPSCS